MGYKVCKKVRMSATEAAMTEISFRGCLKIVKPKLLMSMTFTIIVHFTSKLVMIVCLDISISVKSIKEFGSIIIIQLLNNGLNLDRYLDIGVHVYMVVQENSVTSDYRFIIWATLLQANKVLEHSFRGLLNKQRWNHHDTLFLEEINIQDGFW